MQYPFWDAPFGYGILMGSIAILHVFVSHFAIGGGFYLVVSERAARRENDAARLLYLEKLSKFFTLTTLVTGALTGVGIWFIIGLLNPAATEVLIHNFVWGWATEWTFFVVEILAAILYFYGWRRMSPADHMKIGWIYFLFAWLSLFIINGILTFMLTPGTWITSGSFWEGFFNPTFWSSLALRTCICIMLAGLYALLVAARMPPEEAKSRLVRHASAWGICGLAAALPSLFWYWRTFPQVTANAVVQNLVTPMQALRLSYWFAGGIAILLMLIGILVRGRLHTALALLLIAMGLGWFGSFEWFRESARKPFIITGYMYGNGVDLGATEVYKKDGYLAHITYRSGDDGADLFRHACRSCHTLQGYKPLKAAFDGTGKAFISAIIQSAHLLRGNMPPFLGSAADADQIATCLAAQVDTRALSVITGLQGVALGERVFQIRCGKCHPMGGQGDKTNSLAGLAQENYQALLDNAADLGIGMPAFTADTSDRTALIEYFKTLRFKGGK